MNRCVLGPGERQRNRDMYPARLEECRRALFGTAPELPGQLDMFEGVA